MRAAARGGAASRGWRLLRSAARVVMVVAVAVPVALLPAPAAQAHDSLASSSPAAGATVVTAPRAVTLTFDEPVLDYTDTTVLIVTGPGTATRHFETACARVDGRTVSAAVALGGSGRYTVSWRVVSADGHPVSDTFPFTLHRAAGTTAAAGSVTGPACGNGATGASGAAASSSVSPVVWALVGVGGGLVLVLLLVVVIVAVRLSRRPTEAEDVRRGST